MFIWSARVFCWCLLFVCRSLSLCMSVRWNIIDNSSHKANLHCFYGAISWSKLWVFSANVMRHTSGCVLLGPASCSSDHLSPNEVSPIHCSEPAQHYGASHNPWPHGVTLLTMPVAHLALFLLLHWVGMPSHAWGYGKKRKALFSFSDPNINFHNQKVTHTHAVQYSI